MKSDNASVSPSNSSKASLSRYFFGVLFILMGIVAMAWLAFSIAQNPDIKSSVEAVGTLAPEASSPIMVFLLDYGIIMPILTLAAGIAAVWLGIRLFSGGIRYAHWAQVILLWLAVIGLGLVIINAVKLFSSSSNSDGLSTVTSNSISPWVLAAVLLLALFLGGCSFWLKRRGGDFFHGIESPKSAEVRFAWNLLIPTLAVLIFVAGRPLEQTFIRSLTDKRFAGQEVPNFVGLENYQNLLGIRFDIVDCRMDEETGECALSPNQKLQWETIETAKLQEGYRPVWTFKLPFSESVRGLTISGLDRDFVKSIWTTVSFTIVSVTLELVLALFFALTVHSNFKGRGLMRAVMLIPWAIPTAISARLWENMLKDTSAGIINKILLDLHIVSSPQAWLSIPALQIPSAIMVDVWKTTPFMALLLLAGLQNISEDLYEAAAVDGASSIKKFFAITLPLLRPTIAVALVFRTLDALRVFDLFNVLFARQQLTMATYNYEMLVGSQRDGYASAVSIIIFILISVFAVIYVRLLNVETE